MTNQIRRNSFPDMVEFVELYKTKTQQELAVYYGSTKLRIRKWIDHFGLDRRPQGGGNNRNPQHIVPDMELYELAVDMGATDAQLSFNFNLSLSKAVHYRRKFLKRKLPYVEEYAKFNSKVRRLSEKTYKNNKYLLNPLDLKRTRCGVPGGHQLDHKIGVREGFDLQMSVEDLSCLENLQIIPWQKNLEKRIYV